MQSIWETPYSVRIVLFLLLGGTIWFLYRSFFGNDRPVGLLLLILLVIAYPVLFYMQATLYPQPFSIPLFLFGIHALTREKRDIGLDIITGLIWGFLIFIAPTFLLTVPLAVFAARAVNFIRWRNVMIVFATVSLVIGSWTLRNWICFHEFIPISSHSGMNLLLGNCENTRPNSGANTDINLYLKAAADLNLNEFERDRYLRNAAVTWIKTHPKDAIILYFEKTLNHFNLWNEFYVKSEASVWKARVMEASYLFLLALLVWRLIDAKSDPLDRLDKYMLAIYFLTAFTMAVFTTRIRYRLPFDFLLIIIIARYLEYRFFRPTKTPTIH